LDRILTQMVTSISEFSADMQGTLKWSQGKPFAVLSNNKTSFYVVSPKHYNLVAEILGDLEVADLVETRANSAKTAVSIDIETL
jgi:PHD/YefM family antitoxin component YafN of YafNO toxin-antitoxin module